MSGNKINGTLKSSLDGYRNFLHSFLSTSFLTIIFIVLSIAAGALIAYPFWVAAVSAPQVFTLLALSLIFIIFTVSTARKFSLKNNRKVFFKKLFRFLVFLGKLFFVTGVTYGAMVLVKAGYWYFSVPLFLIIIILLGLILNGKKKSSA